MVKKKIKVIVSDSPNSIAVRTGELGWSHYLVVERRGETKRTHEAD